MDKENISPEERLLKAIEDEESDSSFGQNVPEKGPQKGAGDLKGAAGGKTVSFFKGLTTSLKRVFSLKPNLDTKSDDPKLNNLLDFGSLSLSIKEIDVKFVNKILLIVLVAFLMFFIYSVQANKRNVSSVSNAIANINYQINSGTIELFKTPQFYLSEIGKRNIFRSYEAQEVEKTAVAKKDVNIKQKLKGIAQQFQVIGVSWGTNARVMLKDTKDNKTYFLKENQFLGSTKAVIKEIQKKKVLLRMGDQEVELK